MKSQRLKRVAAQPDSRRGHDLRVAGIVGGRRLRVESLEGRELLAATSSLSQANWVEQGPRPIINAQSDVPLANNSAVGAIESIAVNPDANADGTSQINVASVNGGVWRTNNVDAANPGIVSWTPLTDQAPSLATGSIAFSPLDRTYKTLYAGTGSLSSKGDEGGPAAGILRTADGGATWANFPVNAASEPRVKTVLPTAINVAASGIQEMVLVAAIDSYGNAGNGGLYRSDDNGQTFKRQSGSDANGSVGLPAGQFTKVIADPSNHYRFYAGVTGAQAGIFRGDFDSATGTLIWTNIDAAICKPLWIG